MYDFHNRITGLPANHAGAAVTGLDGCRQVSRILSHPFVTASSPESGAGFSILSLPHVRTGHATKRGELNSLRPLPQRRVLGQFCATAGRSSRVCGKNW